MEFSPKQLASLTLQALILGGVLGLFYSLLRLSRVLLGERGHHAVFDRFDEIEFPLIGKAKRTARKKAPGAVFLFLLRFFEDVLFCVSAAIGIILLAYVGNNGRIRWFLPIGACVGFTLFEATLGRLLSRFSELLSALIHTALRYLVFFLLFPLKTVVKWICYPFRLLLKAFRARITEHRNAKFHRAEYERILTEVSVGFGCMEQVGLPSVPHVASPHDLDTAPNEKTRNVKNTKRRNAHGRTEKESKRCAEKSSCGKAGVTVGKA